MTCGGARSGNSAMGSVGMEIAPARMMNRAQTVAKTGRRMKKSTNKAGVRLRLEWSRAAHEFEVASGLNCSGLYSEFVPLPGFRPAKIAFRKRSSDLRA